MPTLYSGVAILECVDAANLEELLAAGIGRFLVRRLSDTTIVVDHERLPELKKLLTRLGQTPRFTAE